MKRKRLEQDQHLTREQVLTTLKALEYPPESIVSTVNIEGFVKAERVSPENLSQTIDDVLKREGNRSNRLILFRVDAEKRVFAKSEGENNHYVALHFTQNGPPIKLTYIDPTGAKISPQIKETIKSSHPSLRECLIESSQAVLQYTNKTWEGGVYQMGGNDSDCGVSVALAAELVRRSSQRRDPIRSNESLSRELGQILTQVTNREKFWNMSIRLLTKFSAVEQAYDNSSMELLYVLTDLRKNLIVTRFISEFGEKSLTESTKFGTGNLIEKGRFKRQKITPTISSAQSDLLDIMCLAQLLFEGGNEKISLDLQIKVIDMQIELESVKYPMNFEYLKKRIENFKPAIYKNLK